MSATLLDVNVLIALFDAAHPSHDEAHDYFASLGDRRWATTPLTIDGFVRVVSNPAYPTTNVTPREAAAQLRELSRSNRHVFWSDDVSLLSEELFRLDAISGHRQISDIRLLALAVRRGGRLATFDRKLPLKAVRGATSRTVDFVG